MARRLDRGATLICLLGVIAMSCAGNADLEGIVPEGAEMVQVATGFRFTEGPAWGPDGVLHLSDIPANQILRIDADEEVSVFVEPSRNSNGLMFDEDGTLIACRHDGRDVVRISPEGEIEVIADRHEGGRFNSPNDCVIAADGAVYFTDPIYGLGEREKEQDVEGVYRLAPDGTVARVVDDMTRPNGLFISPDGATLYVADSEDRKIRAYALADDGSASAGRDFADMRSEAEGVPDGMTLDQKGNVYCTGGGGIWVFAPDGEHLGMIGVPEVPANCTFGGPDNRTLYITARTSVYRVELLVPGLR